MEVDEVVRVVYDKGADSIGEQTIGLCVKDWEILI